MTEEKAFEIYVDRQQPPRLSYDDTNGEPILAYHGPREGWVLHVEHYQPFPMKVTDFDPAFEALAKARAHLEIPLADAYRLPGRRVSLLSKRAGGDERTSYFLDATLEDDGSLTLSGQNLGPGASWDGEYEYWYHVEAKDVPALVVALGGEPGTDIVELLQRRWTGDAVAGLVTRIKTSGVDYRFSSYY